MHSLLDFLLSSNFSHFKDSTILVTQPGVGNSFFSKTIRDWNQLPANTTPANTVEGFRSALKAHPDSN
jgi:ABC-type sugar transport system substrate-binding protein